MRVQQGRALWLAAGLMLISAANAEVPGPLASPADPEARLLSALGTFQQGDLAGAMSQVESLVAAEPNFRLARLVHGDLLATSSGAPLSFDAGSALPRAGLDGLLAEARQRWRRLDFDPAGLVPEVLLRFAEGQRHALIVDLALSRLFVFANENGSAMLVSDHYVSGGKNGAGKERKGDLRTPVGVYFVTERLPGEKLPDKYGPVAFPVDYPNLWDRRHGRTGSGIWLHGVPSDTYSRPPLASDGCVAMSNDDLSVIADLIDVRRTPVLIGEDIAWHSPERVNARRDSLHGIIERWREDWISRDLAAYLAHYSEDFSGRGMGKREWSEYKRRVDAGKSFVQVQLAEISMLAHPQEPDLVVVSFRQTYRSNNFNGSASKQQYWRLERDGVWRILSEEPL